jgi:DNA-binding SARP family transcriptional activator
VFTVRIDGAELDLSPLRPRARSAFRMLALHGGRPVHKEVLVDALWPGNDVESGVRSLQVALSAVRQLLGSAGGDAGALVARDGDSYRFAAADAALDVRCFEDAVRTAAAATAAGDLAAAAAAAEHALELHRGDLLTEEGPAEWVVADRDKYRVDAANMAAILAEAELAQGRPAAAVGACERGQRIDRYNDGLWRLLADGHEASGDRAAAIKARKGYEAVMAELGVS